MQPESADFDRLTLFGRRVEQARKPTRFIQLEGRGAPFSTEAGEGGAKRDQPAPR